MHHHAPSILSHRYVKGIYVMLIQSLIRAYSEKMQAFKWASSEEDNHACVRALPMESTVADARK